MIVDYTCILWMKIKRILIMVIKYIEGQHYNDVYEEMIKEDAGGVFVCLPSSIIIFLNTHMCYI